MSAPSLQIEPLESSLSDRFFEVPKEHLEPLWPVLAPVLSPAFERTRKISMADIYHDIEDGLCRLWCLYLDGEVAGVIVTTAMIFPQRAVFQIMAAAGRDSHRWNELVLPVLEDFAREQGCHSIEIIGRRGWLRLAANRGYKEIEATFSKELTT